MCAICALPYYCLVYCFYVIVRLYTTVALGRAARDFPGGLIACCCAAAQRCLAARHTCPRAWTVWYLCAVQFANRTDSRFRYYHCRCYTPAHYRYAAWHCAFTLHLTPLRVHTLRFPFTRCPTRRMGTARVILALPSLPHLPHLLQHSSTRIQVRHGTFDTGSLYVAFTLCLH